MNSEVWRKPITHTGHIAQCDIALEECVCKFVRDISRVQVRLGLLQVALGSLQPVPHVVDDRPLVGGENTVVLIVSPAELDDLVDPVDGATNGPGGFAVSGQLGAVGGEGNGPILEIIIKIVHTRDGTRIVVILLLEVGVGVKRRLGGRCHGPSQWQLRGGGHGPRSAQAHSLVIPVGTCVVVIIRVVMRESNVWLQILAITAAGLFGSALGLLDRSYTVETFTVSTPSWSHTVIIVVFLKAHPHALADAPTVFEVFNPAGAGFEFGPIPAENRSELQRFSTDHGIGQDDLAHRAIA